jgi:hypothetical protein
VGGADAEVEGPLAAAKLQVDGDGARLDGLVADGQPYIAFVVLSNSTGPARRAGPEGGRGCAAATRANPRAASSVTVAATAASQRR